MGLLRGPALLVMLTATSGGGPLASLLEDLKARGAIVDAETAERLAQEALVRSLDPHAFFLDASACDDAPAASGPEITLLGEGLVVVKVPEIVPGTFSGLREAAITAGGTNSLGMVLDVREASGNAYDDVAAIAGMFAEPGLPLFSIVDYRGVEKMSFSVPTGATVRAAFPVMVLTSEATRDAAEMLVAVLHEQPRVMVVGQPTAGAFRYREWVPLAGSNKVFMATGYARPVGDCGMHVSEAGCLPDIVVDYASSRPVPIPEKHFDGRPLSPEAIEDRALLKAASESPALQRATEILLGLRAVGAGHARQEDAERHHVDGRAKGVGERDET